MFVYSLKASTLKLAALALASILAISALFIFIPDNNSTSSASTGSFRHASSVSNNEIQLKNVKIKTAQDMNSFIENLGWTVEENPIEIVDVIVPDEFNNVYLKYNEIQNAQGLNLEKYKGKSAKRYTYVVTNYPNTTKKVYLNIILYKNKLIAGDVCSADMNGFVHGMINTETKSEIIDK